MSGALPTSPAFADLKIQSYQPTIVQRAISGRRQARQIGGQYFKLFASYAPMKRSDFAPIHAFIIKQRGQFDTFTVTPPVISSAQGLGGGTPLINGASQTGRSVVSDGWPTGATLTVLKAGDFIKFANHTKVYMVTADATCDTSGNATISIEPELQTSPANDTAITYNSVPFTVYCSQGNIIEYETSATGFFAFEIEFCEAF